MGRAAWASQKSNPGIEVQGIKFKGKSLDRGELTELGLSFLNLNPFIPSLSWGLLFPTITEHVVRCVSLHRNDQHRGEAPVRRQLSGGLCVR